MRTVAFVYLFTTDTRPSYCTVDLDEGCAECVQSPKSLEIHDHLLLHRVYVNALDMGFMNYVRL